MASSIYVLYLVDTKVGENVPTADWCSTVHSFPLMWISHSTSLNLSNIVYDKRSTYVKFKNQKRYYSEYMELFKYIENSSNPYLSVKLHTLENDIPDKRTLNLRLGLYLHLYRVYYGERLLLNPEYRGLIDTRLTQLTSDRLVFEPDVPPAERKKQSSQKYAETHRDRLNAKSKRYYERNKLRLKEKRDAAKLLEPTVEPVVA